MLGQYVTHANFSVNDIEAAKAFYGEKLGFTIKRDKPNGTLFESTAGTSFNVYFKPDHQAWASTVFGIEVPNVKEAINELNEKGIQVEKFEGADENGIMSDPEMGEAAWFKDPAGNWICISSNT